MLDADYYPTLAAYLEGLPDGIDSHPGCVAKASLYRAVLDVKPLSSDDKKRLPKPLVELLDHPVPVSSWIPEVHSHAMMLAIYDRAFTDIEAFAKHAYESQRALFTGPLYSIALRIASPELLIKTAAVRWKLFHRGMTFKPVADGNGFGRVKLEYPLGVYEPILLRALCEAIRAILELSTAKDATVEVADCQPTHATLTVQWQ